MSSKIRNFMYKQRDCDTDAVNTWLAFHMTLQKLIPVSDDVDDHGFDSWEEMELRIKIHYWKALIAMSSNENVS